MVRCAASAVRTESSTYYYCEPLPIELDPTEYYADTSDLSATELVEIETLMSKFESLRRSGIRATDQDLSRFRELDAKIKLVPASGSGSHGS